MPPEEQPTTPTAKPEGLRTSASGQWQAPSVGQMQAVLPQYEVLEMLGRGGMGAVYKARQKSLKRLVAIKVLPLGMADDEFKFAERFQNEAQTMAAMNHPAIVSVYDFGETSDGLLYFVMEFVDGTDVQKMIAGSGKLSGEHALEITAHVCDALAYAHKRGVIHRDIKPANILIDQEGHIKVADFGLAKMHDPAQTSGLTRTNMAMGTPDYVAPEVLSPGIVADHRADLYAVGVMLYQMLTGEVPRGMFKLPSQKGIGIDPRFDEIICKAMEHDREERYQSAGDVRRDLDVILTTPQPKDDGTGVVPVEEIPEKVVMNETGGPVESKAGAPARYQRPPVNRSRTPDRKSSMGLWVTIAGVVAALGVAGVIVINPKPAATDMGTQPTLSKANASPPISANGSTQPPTSTPTPPQDITNWQDMTPTILEKARTRSGFLVESGVVRAAPGTEQPPILGVTTTASRHCAVRVAYSGEAQVSLWSANKAGSVYVQTRKQDTIFKLIDTNNATVPLLPAVPNPADFDSELEHVLILAVEDARLRVWIDERFVGEAEHGILEAVGVSLAVLRHTILRKVEIADLTQGPVAAKAGERKPEIAGAVTDWLKTDVWKAPWVREGAVVKAAANDATSWIGKIADGTVRVRFRALDVGPTNAPPLQISVRATPVAGTTKDVRYLFQFLPQKRICHLLYLEKGGGAGTEKTEYLWREKPFLPTSAGSNEFEFEIHAEGDQLSVWSGGQVIASIHDSRVSSGSCGIIANPGIDITRAETTGIGEKKSTVATLPNITNWQDVTAATRDAARTIPHIVVDQDAIRSSAQDSLTIPISPRSRRDCAVRLHHSGGGQIVMRRNDAGFLFVLCQSTQTIFSRYEKDLPKAVSIGPSRIHDAGFDYHQPHETVVVIQGTKIRAWVDGKLIGEAEDTKFTEGTTHIALLPSSVVTKVEIAELDGAALKASDSPSE